MATITPGVNAEASQTQPLMPQAWPLTRMQGDGRLGVYQPAENASTASTQVQTAVAQGSNQSNRLV